MEHKKCTAIVLAAGKGTRMGTDVAKQYLKIGGKPVVVRSLEAFAASPLIDQIILVTAKEQLGYCREEIVEKYGIEKVSLVTEGGRERYESVWKALTALKSLEEDADHTEYVFIHDGARPFVDEEILESAYDAVDRYGACVVGMPVKDTIKLTDANGKILDSPSRDLVWQAQTPQVFSTELIINAFEKLMAGCVSDITDDAMVVEKFGGVPVHMVKGSYENIKITTPEDMEIAESFLKKREKNADAVVKKEDAGKFEKNVKKIQNRG